MELTYETKKLRELCLNNYIARRTYGPEIASRLRRRLADLAAVSVVSELTELPGKPYELTGERSGQMAVFLLDGRQLVFKSGHITERTLVSGKVDWSRVRRVKILGVKNENE